jgi:formate dehydrogenase (coenzyme F420) beta subunit
MKAKPVTNEQIETALGKFLAEEARFLLGFEKTRDGIAHRLFTKDAENVALFNPSFSTNGALYLRRIFSKGMKMLLLLRPCEIRAYVELIKLTQIERESVVAVSLDCFGTLSSKEDLSGLPGDPAALKAFMETSDKVRTACKACREPRGAVGDAGIRLDDSGSLVAIAYNERGEEFLSLLPDGEIEVKAFLLPQPTAPAVFESNMDTFSRDFSKCIGCMNCRDMCPVCYCIDCVFNGDEYISKGDALINKITRTGSTDLPQGKELFHFIRMFHVSQTCVACGACEEACPQGIPLTKYFKGTSERLQALFSYISGRDFDEAIPYVTFAEHELENAED